MLNNEQIAIYEIENVRVPIPNRSYDQTHGVSMCCIILNEEAGIVEFLKYHKPYFKEIIMVDLGSTDRTIELATPLIDSIILYKQDGHHSNALNRVLEKVTNNWTFLIDCDERIGVEILRGLDSLINQEEYDCYALARRNFIDGEPDSALPMDYQDRLFRSYCRMVRPVHQELVGYKSKKQLPNTDGMCMMHRKRAYRHILRNIGYTLYEYKFKNEMGGPGNQTKDTFTKEYPQLTWDMVMEKIREGQ